MNHLPGVFQASPLTKMTLLQNTHASQGDQRPESRTVFTPTAGMLQDDTISECYSMREEGKVSEIRTERDIFQEREMTNGGDMICEDIEEIEIIPNKSELVRTP